MADDGEKKFVFKYIDPQGKEVKGISSRDHNGRGSSYYVTDDVYEGDFKNGIRTGKGVYTYNIPEQASNKYEGDFKDNKKHGIGLMTYTQKGETYYGQWENGKKHGEGIYTYKNKDVYTGWFAFGEKVGFGTYIFHETGQRFVGTWDKNQLVVGKWILPNGTYYEGKFKNNKPIEEGKWNFKNGNVQSGNYSQIKLDAEDEDTPADYKCSWLTDNKLSESAKLVNDHLNF